MSDCIRIPPAPSPAFTPPDAKTAKEVGLKDRLVKRDLLERFLRERKAGNLDRVLLWALFHTSTTTPALDGYLDKLTEQVGA